MSYTDEMNELDFSYELFFSRQKQLVTGQSEGVDATVVAPEDKPAKQSDVAETKFDPEVSEIDKADYLVAAGSAVLCSVLDILWVEDFSLKNAQKWGKEMQYKLH